MFRVHISETSVCSDPAPQQRARNDRLPISQAALYHTSDTVDALVNNSGNESFETIVRLTVARIWRLALPWSRSRSKRSERTPNRWRSTNFFTRDLYHGNKYHDVMAQTWTVKDKVPLPRLQYNVHHYVRCDASCRLIWIFDGTLLITFCDDSFFLQQTKTNSSVNKCQWE